MTANSKMTVVELIKEANRVGDMIAALPKGPIGWTGMPTETDAQAEMYQALAAPILDQLHAILSAHFGTEVNYGWSLVDEARRMIEYSA